MIRHFQRKPRSSKKGGFFDWKCQDDCKNLNEIFETFYGSLIVDKNMFMIITSYMEMLQNISF